MVLALGFSCLGLVFVVAVASPSYYGASITLNMDTELPGGGEQTGDTVKWKEPIQLMAQEQKRLGIYFGAGCFWRLQADLANVEEAYRRKTDFVTALAGYGGSQRKGPGGLICYHGGPPGSLYETLGQRRTPHRTFNLTLTLYHSLATGYAEAVQLQLDQGPQGKRLLSGLLRKYFSGEFEVSPSGMERRDPQDAGPPYRACIGLPGGLKSRLMPDIRSANSKGMLLKEGKGDDKDEINTVKSIPLLLELEATSMSCHFSLFIT